MIIRTYFKASQGILPGSALQRFYIAMCILKGERDTQIKPTKSTQK